MGAGGQGNITSIKPRRGGERDGVKGDGFVRRAPYKKPPFTLGQLKQAIPPHCFQKSLLRSLAYLIYDLTLAYFFYVSASFTIPTLVYPFPLLAWPIYWALQGCILTGVWVIAHECGHHAFSNYQIVDDVIGLILHSFLLVPYFSWKYSHRRHHSNTGSLDRDEVFVPKPKSRISWHTKYMNNTLGRLGSLIVMLVLGWPLYLLFNVGGRPYDHFACHFDPLGPIFSRREKNQVFISDLGILMMLYFLYWVVIGNGLSWLICMYAIPLLIVNGFLVTITYLQHTHPALPHYDSTEWEWLKGALATVDRDYGVLNKVFHNITDAHVAHHLFSTMPHYHAMEATKAIKPILGQYYQFDTMPFYKALWREAKECLYVEADKDSQEKGVFWYYNI